LKARQREDGKITHEIVQSLGLVDWFKDFHFAYMHADTTPMYLYSVAEYYRRTGDKQFLQEFWPSVKKAYDWCVSVTDKDGLMDNTKAGLGAIEVGVLKGKVTKDIYLEGFWVGGIEATAEMAAEIGDNQIVGDASGRLKTAQESIEAQWWDPEQKYFAFGVTADGRRATMPGNWPAVLLTFDNLDEQKARAQLERLSEPDLASDWGMRTISDKSPLFDPVSYNNGTVWPMIQTWSTWAQYRRGMPWQGFASLHDAANLTGIQSPGYMPEHMNGTFFESGERSVPHQLFSTIGVMVPMVRGLFGLSTTSEMLPDPQLDVKPQLPGGWPSARFVNYATPAGLVSGEVRRSRGRSLIALELHGSGTLRVMATPPIPMGAKINRVLVNGKLRQRASVYAVASLKDRLTVEMEYEGGIDIVPPVASPNPGDRSSALKVIRAAETGKNTVGIEIAGLGGRSYSLYLVSTVSNLTADGATVSKTDDGYRLEIPFEGNGYVTREIRVRW